MAKRYWTGDRQPGRLGDYSGRLCLSCRRPIVYGDRCQQKPRLRRKRKPR